jgi:NTE family protein
MPQSSQAATLASFDNAHQRVDIGHVLVSGALPPGFPPVRIDDRLYWDGGLYSNTPLETVLDDHPRVSTLCFMVDLWYAQGLEPRTPDQVESRRKEVMFASRSERHIETYCETHNLRCRLRALYEQLPPELRQDENVRELAAGGCSTTMHIVRLQYPGRDWRSSSKDINFSRGSIEWRWKKGYEDARRALQEQPWRQPFSFEQGVLVHDIIDNPARGRNDMVTDADVARETVQSTPAYQVVN